MKAEPANFDQYLEQLMNSCENCLLLLAAPWSGHARLYERMLREITSELEPSPTLLILNTQTLIPDQYHQQVRSSPLLYYLRDGQLKGVIEGIPTRFHLTSRLYLLNQSPPQLPK